MYLFISIKVNFPGLVQFSSVAQSYLTLCDPMNHSTPSLPVHHQLPKFTQTCFHRVSDAIQLSYPLSSPSPPAPNPSQYQSLFQWVNSLKKKKISGCPRAWNIHFKLIWAYLLEKAMATHSSILAWKIPWVEEPDRLQSMGSLRVRHDWATSLSLFTFMHWRRTWQPTPVFLPGESQGWRSLVGCRLWGRTELDTTEAT